MPTDWKIGDNVFQRFIEAGVKNELFKIHWGNSENIELAFVFLTGRLAESICKT